MENEVERKSPAHVNEEEFSFLMLINKLLVIRLSAKRNVENG